MKEFLTKRFFARIGEVVYVDVLYPYIKKKVEDSSTPYDDVFLNMADQFIKEELLKDLLEEDVK